MAAWTLAAVLLRHVVEPMGLAPEPPPPVVVVEGVCDDAAALTRQLGLALPERAVALSVRLQVEVVELGWRGSLMFEIDGVTHERTLSAESCEALYEASALVVAFAVQPGDVPATETEPPVETPPLVSVPSAPGADSSGADSSGAVGESLPETIEVSSGPADPSTGGSAATAPSVPERKALWLRGQLGGGVALAVLHPVHPVVAAGVELGGARWAAGLDALYMPPLAATVTTTATARAIVQLGALHARGCAVWRFVDDRLRFPLCAGLAAGLAAGRGEGESLRNRSGREAWVAVLAGPRLRWHSRWGGDLWLAADLVVPLLRPNFVIDEQPVCCESPVGGMVSIGGAWSGPIGRMRGARTRVSPGRASGR